MGSIVALAVLEEAFSPHLPPQKKKGEKNISLPQRCNFVMPCKIYELHGSLVRNFQYLRLTEDREHTLDSRCTPQDI